MTIIISSTLVRTASKKPGAKDTLYHRLGVMNAAVPVGKLPQEILEQIFMHANEMRSPEHRTPWVHPSRRKPLPILLSQVSRYWRHVAVNYVFLWTNIDVSPPWSLNTIRIFLKRSKSCPIHLTLSIPALPSGGHFSPAAINASSHFLCDALKPHIARCSHITVKGDFERLTPFLDAFLATIRMTHTPRLQCLILHVTGWLDPDFHDEFRGNVVSPLFAHSATELIDVRLSGLMLPSPNSSFSSHPQPIFSKLRSLHLSVGDPTSTYSRLSFVDFTALLNKCPFLTTLALYDDFVLAPWPLPPDTTLAREIYLPCLKKLRVYGAFPCLPDFLHAIYAPLLHDLLIAPIAAEEMVQWAYLCLCDPGDFDNETDDVFLPPLAPRFPALKTLTLSPVSAKSFFEVFTLAAACFPDVESLTIPNPNPKAFDEVFTAMRRKNPKRGLSLHVPMVVPVDIYADADLETTQPLFPKLKTLALRDIDDDTWRALERAIVFRERRMCPIQTICLDERSLRRHEGDSDAVHGVKVVERDVWEESRSEDVLFEEEGCFVGDV